MPTYTFIDNNTNESETLLMTISEMEAYLKKNKNKSLAIVAPMIVSGVDSSRSRPDSGFRDILKTIKKHNRGSKINTFD